MRQTMEGRGYPRPGFPIAPLTLKEVLDVPVPKLPYKKALPEGLRFCDLDETAWKHLGPRACKKLATMILERVRAAIHHLPPEIRARKLPAVFGNLRVEELELEFRTHNCLKKAGLRGSERLCEKTIGEISGLRGFGAKCLVDLLTSLESLASVSLDRGTAGTDLGRQITKEATKLRRMRLGRSIHRSDPRLGQLIRSIDGRAKTVWELADKIAQLPPQLTSETLLQRLKKLRRSIQRFSRKTLEEELESLIFHLSKSERNRTIIVAYFGFNGGGGSTLQALGDAFGISRARVQQICSRITRSSRGMAPFAPVLDRAIRAAARAVSGSCIETEIETKLLERGLTRGRFRLEGLERAAEIFGRTNPFASTGGRGSAMSVSQKLSGYRKSIMKVARKTVGLWGAARFEDVARQVMEETGKQIKQELLIKVLVQERDFLWLDQPGGWFWLKAVPRNRVVNRIKKILSVAGRISASELRSGLARHYRMEGFSPPRRVLLELCRQLPDYRVEGEEIIAPPSLDWRKVLGSTERLMVGVLKDNGLIMPRAKLEEICLNRGMNRATFYLHLDNSPVIAKFSPGVYGLPGTLVPPGLAEEMATRRKRFGRRLVDYGWTQDGKIWVFYSLSDAMVTSGVFHLPSAMRNFLDGKFIIKAVDGTLCGTLVAKRGIGWGMGPFIRQYGIKEGEHLSFIFDLKKREATVGKSDDSSFADHIPIADREKVINKVIPLRAAGSTGVCQT